ncbi:NTE family protein [Formivibrio citricus]|uniref:NTE family protein n=1 Tax=Formivibrio citricus TaxID=83765 RepID=A0A1I5BGC5_9NEIS|nr:patatin-like phospholipase family protein [Formivibrio citricus]SFN73765.1 NTE family protein [Formivibrio citricus]
MTTYTLSLALQGGGSHGAFTWGVLDRLLEEDIAIDAVSGASAGALNAAVLASGYAHGKHEGARQALRSFWEAVATSLPQPPLNLGFGTSEQPGATMQSLLMLSRFFSPSEFNPFDLNPLREILKNQIDVARLQADTAIRLFIATTRANTGTLRLFRNKQITLDVLLASACLPTLHHTVTIDGEPYWDGGLTANPPIFPLVHLAKANDIMVVMLNPCRWPDTPQTAAEIGQRLSEISFGAAFHTELQGLMLAKRTAHRSLFGIGQLERRLRELHLHLIDAQSFTSQLPTLSKLNTHLGFIEDLHQAGRERASAWLKENGSRLGRESTFRLQD